MDLLARTYEPAIEAFWQRAGLTPGMRCLDLGCGPVAVTLSLARRVGPDGVVVGVDRDADAIAVGRERVAAAGLTNVRLVVADAYDYAADAAFDFVYSRLLLHHLSRPEKVLRSMCAALRPGGVLAVEDADFTGAFCYPPNAGFDFWLDRYCALVRRNGGDPALGRRLVELFIQVGLPAPELTVAQRVERDGPAKQLPALTLVETADAMIDAGVANRGELDAAVADLRTFLADPRTVYAGPRHLQACARVAV